MAGNEWGPIESSTPGRRPVVEGERAWPGAASAQHVVSGPGRLARVVVPLVTVMSVVGLVAAAATGGVTLARQADLPSSLAGPSALESDGGTDTEDSADTEATPIQAFARAVLRLEEARTFTYRGTVEASHSSLARPGLAPGGRLTVAGEVEMPSGTHEIATGADGRAYETVTRNVTVWGRQAADEESLPSQAFEVIGETRGYVDVAFGAGRLPAWLMSTVDRRADAPDEQGRARYRGRLTAWTDGGADGLSPSADVVLTIDEGGDPVHIEITAAGGGAPLVLDLEIERLGEIVSVSPPGGRPTSVTGDVTPEAVQAAGIPVAVELGDVPEEWILYDIELKIDSPVPGCSTLVLNYADASGLWSRPLHVDLNMTSADCSFSHMADQPVTLGTYSGLAYATGDVWAFVSDGRTNLEVRSDLPVEELEALFASIEPFDPTTRPETPD